MTRSNDGYRFSRRTLLKSTAAAAALAPLGRLWIPGARAADNPITLGLVTPLSGAQEMIGSFVRHGAEIAIEKINADGGVNGRPLALEMRDSKANPAAATVAARELLGQGVNLQLGTIGSPVALAMGPLMQAAGGVVLTCGAGTEKLNHEGYNPHVFRIGDSPYSRQYGLIRMIAERYPNITSWGGIIPDHEYGRTTWAIFVDAMLTVFPQVTGKQPEISRPILIPYGSGDYKNFIAAAMRQPFEGLYTSAYGGDAVTLYQQARPFGLFDKTKVLVDSANEFLVPLAMKDQTPDTWTGTHWYFKANQGNPMSDHLYNAYVERTGNHYPMGWAAEAHAAVYAYKAAIEKTGGDTKAAAIIAALKGLTFDTATGKRTLRAEDNQAVKNAEAMRIQPKTGSADGFEVTDYISVPGDSVVEPPRPGEKLELKTL
ncbi:ABC transporter substrate-binding protein (plasmid) [Tistrella bauzanensis]|uniref:ABC transporter substrate-binding protein n=1 Tax=Tistrella arctica TaxID=3133430 RepID=A0ABU9YP76_9PROT